MPLAIALSPFGAHPDEGGTPPREKLDALIALGCRMSDRAQRAQNLRVEQATGLFRHATTIAEEIEDPFGEDSNDLPMQRLSEVIARNARETLE